MAEKVHQTGELALVKAVRSLDQGGSDAIPDKLDQIWKILSICTGGKFHAAEEMLLRWLLKNMNGASEGAQKLRRYPLTWRILGNVFTAVPLFSLAKSLADRRFVPILQTTLNDISKPTVPDQKQASDTEMADADAEEDRPRKKKRSEDVRFDLESQSSVEGCLRTAEALFEALRLLLARLDSSNTKRNNDMGAEHIKSLFCSSASDIKDLILPALLVCKVWADSKPEEREMNWLSAVCDLWDLHLQGDGDAMQVAAHLSSPAISILGKAEELDDFTSMLDSLRHFLTRNLILPARAAFLNQGDLEIIRQTLQSTAGFSTVSCPVILDLALSSPSLAGSQTAKRDNDSWIQGVFSLLVETLQSSRSTRRLAAIHTILQTVGDQHVSIPVDSLRTVCRNFALQTEGTDWLTLVLVARISPDAFIGKGDDDLFQAVLDRIKLDGSNIVGDDWSEADAQKADFLKFIAEGFEKARDPSTFVKIWFERLAAIGPHTADVEDSRQYQIWFNDGLRKRVAQSIKKTMNTKQILSLVDWLDSQVDQPAENATANLLLETLSRATKEDDVVDTVGMRLFEIISKRSLPATTNPTVVASKWTVARRCLMWATLEERKQIWVSSVEELRKILALSPSEEVHVFQAFKFAAAAWIVNYPGGQYENEAAELTLTALSPLNDTPLSYSREGGEHPFVGYLTGIYGGSGKPDRDSCPRLLSLILEREADRIRPVLKSAMSLKFLSGDEDGDDVGYEVAEDHLRRVSSIFSNEDNTNSRATMDTLLKLLHADLQSMSECWEYNNAAEALLALPDEAITREQREDLMGLLAPVMASYPKHIDDLDAFGAIVSLMVKLMRKPTFYPNMAFSDLDDLATCIQRCIQYNDSEPHLKYLPYVEELATLTLRQMTANIGTREEQYLRLAVSTMKERMRPALGGADPLSVFRVVLLKTLILAVLESSAVKAVGNLGIRELEHHLIEMIESVVEQFCSNWEKEDHSGSNLLAASAVLEAAEDLYQHAVTDNIARELKKALSPYVSQLKDASRKLASKKNRDIWALRKYLASVAGEGTESFLDLGPSAEVAAKEGGTTASMSALGNKEGILSYVDTVMADADDKTRLAHIETLIGRSDTSNPAAQLLAVHRIVEQLGNKPSAQATNANQPTFDLATLHTILCKRLRSTESTAEFVLIAQTLQTILDDKANTMTQWNIELTLSTVSLLASEVTTHKVMSTTPKAYELLCRLVQVIVRRHRLRLEGHFHLLVTVLQSLLRALVCHPYLSQKRNAQQSSGVWTTGLIKDPSLFDHWQKHAKAFGRLLTMVCEPTPGSVARSQQNSLDSATDAAKRYAGQHMYLVLMLYIKLQLEQNVPHDVREALEPGVFAILDITTPEARRVMNDALDPSGRAIMKELFKQYLKFGKWSGI
ncbi:Urb2/Npa2 family-domain-containing protein [Coniochaeta sp. 2T2.1]|nr:Urb2/Npa2 family-domain-containing protein [Coniochaeta sp. 2T2.1]